MLAGHFTGICRVRKLKTYHNACKDHEKDTTTLKDISLVIILWDIVAFHVPCSSRSFRGKGANDKQSGGKMKSKWASRCTYRSKSEDFR